VKNAQANRIPEDTDGLVVPDPVAGKHVCLLPHSASPNLLPFPASRRLFLKGGVAALAALGIWLMDRLAQSAESTPEGSETTLTVPWNIADGIHFHDRVIVINGPRGFAVFSSTCTHLGCRINHTEGNELVCPCHGSRFNLRGDAVHGPAVRGLRGLPFTLDRTKGVLRITLEKSET
jgi:cytochrome b6-f complex iron-sulfur subunit